MTLENHKAAPAIQNTQGMNRKARLKIAKKWLESIDSSEKIQAYMKFFGVDRLCAAIELLQAGVVLHEKYADRWATRIERKALARQKKKLSKGKETQDELHCESDEFFYFIAGYTEGGAPYGITWEQAKDNALISRELHE